MFDERIKTLKADSQIFYSLFKQQRIPGSQPIKTYKTSIILFLSLSTFFLCVGCFLLYSSLQIYKLELPYSSACRSDSSCTLNFELARDIQCNYLV